MYFKTNDRRRIRTGATDVEVKVRSGKMKTMKEKFICAQNVSKHLLSMKNCLMALTISIINAAYPQCL